MTNVTVVIGTTFARMNICNKAHYKIEKASDHVVTSQENKDPIEYGA